jgi:hypothetical protein
MGALVTAVLLGALPLPFGIGRTHALLERLPTRALAHVRLGRIADTMVADSRSTATSKTDITFYDEPVPYGPFLCSVHLYRTPGHGFPGSKPGAPDSLEMTTAYGVWANPSETVDGSVRGQERACAAYRDFEHLFVAGERADHFTAVLQFDDARDAAVAGKVNFPIACLSYRPHGEASRCDGPAVLKSLDLKQLVRVEILLGRRIREDDETHFLTFEAGSLRGETLETVISITNISPHDTAFSEPGIRSITIHQEIE